MPQRTPATRPEQSALLTPAPCPARGDAPRLTVLLPVYNGATTVDAALDSLRQQTLTAWEAVVVDDGSQDGTWECVCAQARLDARIRPLRLAHQGLVPALHAALAASHPHAPYLARLDADDVALPRRLELQTAYLDDHPACALVSSRVLFGGDPQTAGGFARHVDWLNSLDSPEKLAISRFRESPLAHPAVMFRRSTVQVHGFYAAGPFPEDYELWLRWMDAGETMASLPQVLTVWNDPPGRLTRTHPHYSQEAFAALRVRYLARYLVRHNAHHPDVWVIGASRMSRRRALPLAKYGVRIRALIDVDPRKIGNTVQGLSVLGREALPRPGEGMILVFLSGHGAAEDAADFLCGRGYVEGRDFLLAS